MEWAWLPLKRFADFRGRSRRKEFWAFFLAQILAQIVLLFAIGALFIAIGESASVGSESQLSPTIIIAIILAAIWGLLSLVLIIPNAALVVRRFHDQGISGWVGGLLYVGMLILTFPGLIILIFMLFEGKRGPNDYGPDPKSETIGDVFL